MVYVYFQLDLFVFLTVLSLSSPILEWSFKFDWVEKSAVEGGGGVIRNMRVDVMQNNAMLRCWDAMCQDCNWVVSSYKSDLAYKWGVTYL